MGRPIFLRQTRPGLHGKPFTMMLYPKSRHGITDPALVRHSRGMMLDFILEHLKPNDSVGTR